MFFFFSFFIKYILNFSYKSVDFSYYKSIETFSVKFFPNKWVSEPDKFACS